MSKEGRQLILFCPIHPTSLNKMLHIAAPLNTNRVKSVFLVSNNFIASQQSRIKGKGFELVFVDAYETYVASAPDKIASYSKSNRKGLFKPLYGLLYSKIRQLPLFAHYFLKKENLHRTGLQENLKKEYKLKQQQVFELFEQMKPDKLVVAGDRHLRYEVVVLTEAKQRGIPVFIPPISVFSHPTEIARTRFLQSKEFDVSDQQDIRRCWPKQYEEDGYGNKASFYHYWMLKPLDELGLLPENPWVMGASYADRIMVSGQHEANRLLSNGLSESKLAITGDSEFDELYDCFQDRHKLIERLVEKYNFSKKCKTIVIALPQLFEHGLLSFEEHWKVINNICETLKDANANILVSLHPKMKLEHYKHLEKQYSLSIADEPLRNILVAGNVFIASQGSSTWVWATLCGIPTLLCDWYEGPDQGLIDPECGVEEIKSENDFAVKLIKLLQDEQYYMQQKSKQLNKAKEIALFDGHAMDRISKLLIN